MRSHPERADPCRYSPPPPPPPPPTDAFSEFERRHPELIAIDSHGFEHQYPDFAAREREEMRVLSQATEICPNIWLGNSQDVPLVVPDSNTTASQGMTRSASNETTAAESDASSVLDDGNPLAFAICIDAHDHGTRLVERATRHAVFAAAHEHFAALEREALAGALEHDFAGDKARLAELDLGAHSLRPPVERVVHLEAPATLTSVTAGAVTHHAVESARDRLVDCVVELAFWLVSQANTRRRDPLAAARADDEHPCKLARRVLLHCGDGYTETSLLALACVMVSRRCSAPDAYLALQLDLDRSFFVYPHDVDVLERVARRIGNILRPAPVAADADDDDAKSVTPSRITASDSGYSSLCEQANDRTPTRPSKQRQLATMPESPLASTAATDPWFHSPYFDGHFPSRILPFLYLGNWNHASNALMLRQLGITHVVSVGESALVEPANNKSAAAADKTVNSLWLERERGNVDVLDLEGVLNDGIDSLRPHVMRATAFIEHARRTGGRALVHCRVGVSRSASIVIAYLMQHLGLDLVSSYLLTRSRRLNILIQPTLPFMATLHALEAELLEHRDAQRRERRAARMRRLGISASSACDTTNEDLAPSLLASLDADALSSHDSDARDDDAGDVVASEHKSVALRWPNRMAWPILCREIASLNERYLC